MELAEESSTAAENEAEMELLDIELGDMLNIDPAYFDLGVIFGDDSNEELRINIGRYRRSLLETTSRRRHLTATLQIYQNLQR